MATTNNAVSVTAGLTCTAISTPAIGTPAVSASIAYKDGETAQDTYKLAETASATTLITGDGDGFVMVTNPSTNLYNVTLSAGVQVLGPLPPGFGVVIPISSAVALKGQSGTADQYVGVTWVATEPNV